jgi:hypothetical protein
MRGANRNGLHVFTIEMERDLLVICHNRQRGGRRRCPRGAICGWCRIQTLRNWSREKSLRPFPKFSFPPVWSGEHGC